MWEGAAWEVWESCWGCGEVKGDVEKCGEMHGEPQLT